MFGSSRKSGGQLRNKGAIDGGGADTLRALSGARMVPSTRVAPIAHTWLSEDGTNGSVCKSSRATHVPRYCASPSRRLKLMRATRAQTLGNIVTNLWRRKKSRAWLKPNTYSSMCTCSVAHMLGPSDALLSQDTADQAGPTLTRMAIGKRAFTTHVAGTQQMKRCPRQFGAPDGLPWMPPADPALPTDGIQTRVTLIRLILKQAHFRIPPI